MILTAKDQTNGKNTTLQQIYILLISSTTTLIKINTHDDGPLSSTDRYKVTSSHVHTT